MSKVTLSFLLLLLSFPSWSADFEKGLIASRNGDYATALREWTPLAEQGHATSQRNLGHLYYQGLGVPQDDKTALKWMTLAAEQGDATAQNNLGFFYHTGVGVPQDDKTALKWFTLAAEQGHVFGYLSLGQLYASGGTGVPQDTETAMKWYVLAAEQGNETAQKALAELYEKNRSTRKQDIQKKGTIEGFQDLKFWMTRDEVRSVLKENCRSVDKQNSASFTAKSCYPVDGQKRDLKVHFGNWLVQVDVILVDVLSEKILLDIFNSYKEVLSQKYEFEDSSSDFSSNQLGNLAGYVSEQKALFEDGQIELEARMLVSTYGSRSTLTVIYRSPTNKVAVRKGDGL